MSLFAAILALTVQADASGPFCSEAEPVASLGIVSANSDALAQWYAEKLGFTIVRETGDEKPWAYELTCGPVRLMIELPAEPIDPAKGSIKVGWKVEDFDAAVAASTARGVTIADGPMTDACGMRSVVIVDLDGNELRLFDRLINDNSGMH